MQGCIALDAATLKAWGSRYLGGAQLSDGVNWEPDHWMVYRGGFMGCLDLVFGENHLLMKDGVGKKRPLTKRRPRNKKIKQVGNVSLIQTFKGQN